MIYIGVDPGKSGGYAWFQPGYYKPLLEPTVEVYPWDDDAFVKHMREIEMRKCGYIACIEKVGAMPGQGVTSMFNFGKSAGFIEGVLTALGIPYQLIPPKKWKGEFGLNSDKAASVAVCKKLFPDVSLRRSDRCRKDDDGMAEALLMALYANRKM